MNKDLTPQPGSDDESTPDEFLDQLWKALGLDATREPSLADLEPFEDLKLSALELEKEWAALNMPIPDEIMSFDLDKPFQPPPSRHVAAPASSPRPGSRTTLTTIRMASDVIDFYKSRAATLGIRSYQRLIKEDLEACVRARRRSH